MALGIYGGGFGGGVRLKPNLREVVEIEVLGGRRGLVVFFAAGGGGGGSVVAQRAVLAVAAGGVLGLIESFAAQQAQLEQKCLVAVENFRAVGQAFGGISVLIFVH